jgi:hypothetical protein
VSLYRVACVGVGQATTAAATTGCLTAGFGVGGVTQRIHHLSITAHLSYINSNIRHQPFLPVVTTCKRIHVSFTTT